jgi:inorganic pyrophosphatase
MQRTSAATSKNRPSDKPQKISVIIETPRGSRNKLKYDPAKQIFKLSKVMPEGMVFPYDFGFVPGTMAADGGPLDVLVLTDEPLFTGCSLDCLLVGAIEAEQEEGGNRKRNDRLIAVAQASLLYWEIKDLAQINPALLKQIQSFFVNYQKVRDIEVDILGTAGPGQASEILRRSRRSDEQYYALPVTPVPETNRFSPSPRRSAILQNRWNGRSDSAGSDACSLRPRLDPLKSTEVPRAISDKRVIENGFGSGTGDPVITIACASWYAPIMGTDTKVEPGPKAGSMRAGFTRFVLDTSTSPAVTPGALTTLVGSPWTQPTVTGESIRATGPDVKAR